MKTIKYSVSILLLFCLSITEINATANSSHWRWRNDNGNELTATWRSNEDQSSTVNINENIRLRVSLVHTSGPNSSGYSRTLDWSTDKSTWLPITNDASNPFIFSTSTHVADNSPLADSPGIDNSDATGGFEIGGLFTSISSTINETINVGKSRELEYCIQATVNALAAPTYYFRVASKVATSDVYPELKVNNPLGIEDYDNNKLVIYPNPSKDIFNIQGQEINSIEVFNSDGTIIKTQSTKKNNTQVDLSNQSNGVYYIKVISNSNSTTHKVIKK